MALIEAPTTIGHNVRRPVDETVAASGAARVCSAFRQVQR
jgi:hypothetical protein